MATSPKAVILESISETKAVLKLSTKNVELLVEDLKDLGIDEDIVKDYRLAVDRLNYVCDILSRMQRNVRGTLAEYSQRMPKDRRNTK